MSDLFALKRIGYGLQTLINQVFSIERSMHLYACSKSIFIKST